jgi:hypothetical protein
MTTKLEELKDAGKRRLSEAEQRANYMKNKSSEKLQKVEEKTKKVIQQAAPGPSMSVLDRRVCMGDRDCIGDSVDVSVGDLTVCVARSVRSCNSMQIVIEYLLHM